MLHTYESNLRKYSLFTLKNQKDTSYNHMSLVYKKNKIN